MRGSPVAKAREIARRVVEIPGDFATVVRAKGRLAPGEGAVPTAEEREAALARARAEHADCAQVDVRGRIVRTREDPHRLLHPFRDPEFEILHFLFVDDEGRTLGHMYETSSAIDYVRLFRAIRAPRGRTTPRTSASA